jgi:hypothetical protein
MNGSDNRCGRTANNCNEGSGAATPSSSVGHGLRLPLVGLQPLINKRKSF